MKDGKFFYTLNYPHKWGPGPVIHYYDPKDWSPIRDMEHAKQLAEEYEIGRPGEENYCETSYGVVYPTRGVQH